MLRFSGATSDTMPYQETGKPWELFVPNARGCGIRPFAGAARKPVSTGTERGTSRNAGSHPPVSFTLGLNSALPFSSKVRAVCTSSARTDLHGGSPARVVPTVTVHSKPRKNAPWSLSYDQLANSQGRTIDAVSSAPIENSPLALRLLDYLPAQIAARLIARLLRSQNRFFCTVRIALEN